MVKSRALFQSNGCEQSRKQIECFTAFPVKLRPEWYSGRFFVNAPTGFK